MSQALEPWSYGIYAGGQSILVGAKSGLTLAPEGGAHQSITNPIDRAGAARVRCLGAGPRPGARVVLPGRDGSGGRQQVVAGGYRQPDDHALAEQEVTRAEFGQSMDLTDAYRIHHVDTGSIADAALTMLGS